MADTARLTESEWSQCTWLADFVHLTGEEGPLIVRRRFIEFVGHGDDEWAGGTILDLSNGRRIRVHEKPDVVFDRILGE